MESLYLALSRVRNDDKLGLRFYEKGKDVAVETLQWTSDNCSRWLE